MQCLHAEFRERDYFFFHCFGSQQSRNRRDHSIDGIVSQEIIAELGKRLKASYEKKRREGQKFEEGEVFYTYGIYDFRTGEVKP